MNALWKKNRYVVGMIIAPGILAACGGGGDGPGKCYSPNPAICAAVGVPRSFPETPVSPVSPAGLYRGVTDNGRAVAALVLDDHSFYSLYSAVNNPSVAAGAMQGTIPASGQTVSFTANYSADYELIPSLSIIAGAYTGSLASPVGPESVVVEISAAGAISGRSSIGVHLRWHDPAA